MNNYYQVLGVAHDASPAIVKIAYEGKLKAAAKLPEAERKAEERLLEQAYVTLSNPAKKSWYDKQFEQAESEASSGGKKGLVIAAVVVGALAVGIGWYTLERSKQRERVRLEEARIAIEAEKARAQAEIEQARLLETQQAREQVMDFARQTQQDSRAYQERAYQDRQRGVEEDRAYQAQARDRALKGYDERARQQQEDRARRLADEDRRKAQADVDRQKRFVAEREREEERIRTERHNRAVREAADARRRELEEQRRKK